MNVKILKAQPVVDQIKGDLTRRCEALKKKGITPSMSVVLVGDNPASLSYIRNKKKMCEEVGAHFSLHQLDSTISETDFLAHIRKLNDDPSIHGIIIQLPVSESLKKLDLPNLITSKKDIDGFHGINTQNLYTGSANMKLLLPCTPKGVVSLLQYYGVEIAGANVVVLGRSLIVGKPLSMLLGNLNATVTLAHSKTKNLKTLTRQCDIFVSAIGKAHFIDESYFDPKMKTTVIDVGINSLDGKLVGDVKMDTVQNVVAGISPVPGGVGPMTVISLVDNLITATEHFAKGSL
jgi:methylenetetrahydrofolate dehydrogenase (NADP+)/methenyltetrahydrofolate cyclohydrolase